MNRLDRLFAMTLLLQSRKRIRAYDLARAFEVSERTVYRDIAALCEGGVPIVSLPGEGYELMEGFYLPPRIFTRGEADALFLGANLLAAYATGRIPAEAQQALDKIAAILPGPMRQEMERLADTIHFGMSLTRFDLDEPRLATLQRAIRERHVLRISYHSQSRNETTRRDIEPRLLTCHDGTWYVEAYCRLRKDMRSFRLDRIDELELLSGTFEPRVFEYEPTADILVQVRFAPGVVRWVRERQHSAFQDEEASPDGNGVVMTYRVGELGEIKSWLMGWGASAEPLSPPELRAAIRREALELAGILT